MNRIDYDCTDDIVCPYCGFALDPDEEPENIGRHDGDESTMECWECGREFVYETHWTLSFSSRKPKAMDKRDELERQGKRRQ